MNSRFKLGWRVLVTRARSADVGSWMALCTAPQNIASPVRGIALAFFNIPERLGGNENRFGCPLIDLTLDGTIKTSSISGCSRF